MKKKRLHILGLMSGTSLDGLDMALCEFHEDLGIHKFKILKACTVPYDSDMKNHLKNVIHSPAWELLAAHESYGKWLGNEVRRFLAEHDSTCDLIASHGHTVHHRPAEGFSFQLGSGQALANTAKIPVVADFRSIDVSLGGEGAPLVPIGDLLLFSQYKYCLNLGGISNISEKTTAGIKAYDIGVANMLLNHLALQAGMEYDKGGALAATGKLNTSLFKTLNSLDFHHQKPPKSLGVEYFNSKILPVLGDFVLPIEDQLHTAVHYIAYQISQCLNHRLESTPQMLLTGGGAKNDFLIECISLYCKDKVTLVLPSADLIDFKEALVFAFMGYLHQNKQPNCLKSVTGASKDHIGGYYFKDAGA